jgi:hypothetical protein
MGILEQVTNLKKQGIPDEKIVNDLSQQGISPNEISNALKQAEIKNAVSGYGQDEEMYPSIMPPEETPVPEPQAYEPQENYYQPQEETYAPQENYIPQTQQYSQTQEQYLPQEQTYSNYQQNSSADLIMEIADQVASEKIKKTQKLAESSSEATILLQNKFENLSNRLKKIETIIDKLQIAILEKVGSYGQNLENIKKEMSMMQDSFSKMISSPKQKEETHKKSSKKK